MTTPAQTSGPADEYAFTDEEFEKIRSILKVRRGFDTATYKERYMRRRITIRIRATDSGSAADYRRLLGENEQEIDRLLRVLTIHVSHFFRNRSTFDRLRDDILPGLFARVREQGRREAVFWSAGCAGGEEPYSLGLLLKDSFAEEEARHRIVIVATDIDQDVLRKAREGLYGEERFAETPPGMVERHFIGEGKKFRISPEIGAMVLFRREDLLRTDLYPRCDLILCRNVLIYFERQQQEKILEGFAQALHPGGILVLGRSETLVGDIRKRFECAYPVERIYRKTS